MSPRYTRPLPEKIMAVVGTFRALATELAENIDRVDPIVQAELIRSAVTLALSSDTSNLPVIFTMKEIEKMWEESAAQQPPDHVREGADDEDAEEHGPGDDR